MSDRAMQRGQSSDVGGQRMGTEALETRLPRSCRVGTPIDDEVTVDVDLPAAIRSVWNFLVEQSEGPTPKLFRCPMKG